jgi:transcription elongation GreA/GreB family factor
MTNRKAALKDELLGLLRENLLTMERAQKATREAATHEEAKPENDKDTRALEQSYLARGQAARLEELRTGVAEAGGMPLRAYAEGQPIGLGALVTAEEHDGELSFFVAPHGGGVSLAKGSVQVVTPKSPLGRALLGRREGEDCELVIAGRTRTLTIVKVE